MKPVSFAGDLQAQGASKSMEIMCQVEIGLQTLQTVELWAEIQLVWKKTGLSDIMGKPRNGAEFNAKVRCGLAVLSQSCRAS